MPANTRKPLLVKGQILNERWEVLSHIATGGKGEVYLAKQLKLDREVALKIVSQEMIDDYEDDQEEIEAEMKRFRREVLAMAKTRHPNVLQVYDFEETRLSMTQDEVALDFIVMEYVSGGILSDTIPEEGLLRDQPALGKWIRDYFVPVLDGVRHIHEQGIVHRDLKPANVLLAGSVPKITDFGLVGGDVFQPVTRSHHVIGTLAYMAPEQFIGMGETDFRADIYSLGKILYNALVGRLTKETMQPLKTAVVPGADTPLLQNLDTIIQKATDEHPEKRHADVGALRKEVLKAVSNRSQTGETKVFLRVVLAVSIVLVALLVGGVWYHFATLPTQTSKLKKLSSPETGNEQVLKKIVKGTDGAQTRLIQGVVASSASGGKPFTPFYLDETEITNHQYVDFLDQIPGRIKVVDGVVRGNGRIWIRLGQVKPGYEPIEFKGGRFRVKDPTLAANPVVNVTALGAIAYAEHFGRRLPSLRELLLAKSSDGPAQRSGLYSETQPTSMTHMQSSESQPAPKAPEPEKLYPVTHFPPNKLGIRGLSANASEWATQHTEKGLSFVVLHPGKPPVAHKLWEASGRIGFRCAKDAYTGKPY